MPILLATMSQFLNGWLIGCAFLFVLFLGFLSGFVRALQSRNWPKTPGNVVESKVQRNSNPRSSGDHTPNYSYEPVVRYTYAVEGTMQESKQIAIGVLATSEESASKVTARYPLGASVTVHHHPKHHYLAVLEPGRFVVPLIATLISAAALYFMAAVWMSKSLHPMQDPSGKTHAAAASLSE